MNSSKELMVGEKPLSSLRVVDLKEELEKRGLSKSGSKKDLADRLKNFLLAEKQKEIPVPAADEEQLPNISMQEKLAEQNPFIRDYFASQAELFHSQKVAKKLLEEEARRESETSAPSADEESSAAEDRSPRKEVEEVPKGKVKRLARRFESRGGRAEEVTTPVEMTVDKPAVEEMPEISLGTPVEIASLDSSAEQKKEEEPVIEAVPVVEQEQVCVIAEKSTDKTNAEKVTEETSKIIEASDLTVSASKNEVADIDDSKIEANEKGNESSSVSSNSPVPASESPEPEVKSPALSPSKPAQEKATGRGISEAEHDKETEKPKDKTSSAEDVIDSKLNKNGNVKKLTEKFENVVAQEPEVVVPQKPIEKQSSVPQTRQENDADADSESSESSGSRSRSRSPKSQRAESPTQKASVSPAKHEPSPEPENKIRKLTRFDRKSESRDEELEISMDVDDQIEIGPIRNGETEKAKTASPSKPQSAVQTKSRREEEIRPNQRKLPEVVDDEEVLDYGEEDKLKMEPARFTWTRRILRLKNKYPPKEHDEKRWKIPEDMTSPIINTEYLMQWFPEVKLVPASEFKLEDKEKSPPPTSVPDKEVENVEVTRKVSIDPEDPSQAPMENITITRKVSLIPMVPSVSQPQEDMDKDLSPPRHPPSELILITNLTRPFTLPQLKELLQRTGNLLDVWVDKIKSRCIAKYEKQEEAFETRAALHGVNWPQSNPKALSVDYTTQERLEDYKARDAGVDVKPVRIEKPEAADNMPVREWDMGKRGKSRSPQRVRKSSRSLSRERKRPRRSQSPGSSRRRHSRSPHHDRRSRGEAKEAEPLGKALDELFRKTAATPSIYWLPLTPQQIAEKEELRRKRMIERERRLAEMSKMRPR